MKVFTYYQPTEIRFGKGRISEIGEVASLYGKRCLLVTVPVFEAMEKTFEKVKNLLKTAGLEVAHFDGVIPNPTVESISAGAAVAKEFGAEVVIGLGGGSSMDSAKAIAVEATHEGTSWDYLFYRETQPTEKTLPIIAISTTSGTGSQVTQVAVVTNTEERDKSAIYHPIVYPKVAIVDPELMLTVPEHVTASTGFDIFCHSFESYLHKGASPYTDLVALEAIRLVAKYLPTAVRDGSNLEAREALAWADTLAGLAIANAGVTLPHGIGMAISGMWPHVAHGESLALTYPAFTRYTYPHAIEQFATMGRIFDPNLNGNHQDVAKKSCEALDEFLKEIGMWLSFEGMKIPKEELPALAKQSMVLPDYMSNPKVATEEEILEILTQSYRR